MKTVNKYILASCVFCYFAGIYLLAVKFGIIRLISHYGLHRAFDEWPEDFPSLTIVYICLAVYTLIFALITYWIYRTCTKHEKDMDVLQQKADTIHNYSEGLNLIVSRYNRICREKNISNKTLNQRLQLLEKNIASLPASVFKNNGAGSRIARIVSDIDDAVANMELTAESDIEASTIQFSNIVEQAIEDVKRLHTGSITIK